MARDIRHRLARVARLALATAAIVGAPRPLAAQQPPIAADCDGDVLAARSAADVGAQYERTPDRVWARLILQRTGRDFAEMGDTARANFEALAPGMEPDAQRRMRALLDTLQRELVRTDTSAEFRLREGPSARLVEIRAGDEGEAWRVGSGENAVEITEATSLATRRAVCWTALLARRIADHGGEAARTEALRVLSARERRWSNFERAGYSLTPIELLVNGWCGACRDELEPPRRQIVLAHVLPSYLLRNGSGSRAALTAEAVGLLFYSATRSSYWGGSVVLAYPHDERYEVGVVLHASRLGQLGVTAPPADLSIKNASLVLSADLYRYIERWQGTLQDERQAVKRGLSKAGGS